MDELEIDNGKVTNMFDDMVADFNVPIVVLDEMKVKKIEEKAKAALEVAQNKKSKAKMEQTPIKKVEKKNKERRKPSRSSARIAASFGFFDGLQSQAIRM
ncbi:hypothetical protein AMTR_s00039p00033440 [Amborella trichopoda]|uniref:Uncharacterized protein n=1 Tax=Amborella trichopoda TaxID=13333 RepID=U5CZX3_AMBTC|nr:hypothetical protein AMTR_s00039p00033440 [Amborella trichopoda]